MDETFDMAFRLMGARVRVGRLDAEGELALDRQIWPRRGRPIDAAVARALLDALRVDARRDDAGGEYFDVRRDERVEVDVADVRPDDRHLLLTAHVPQAPPATPAGAGGDMPDNGDESHGAALRSTFLCGHDEKAWFVAAVPESANARDVQDAKDALKPEAVWDAMREFHVPPERRDDRRTAAFVRQGEWFFIPRPGLRVEPKRVRRQEPIQRGAGRPHVCQFLYRVDDGEAVYVRHDYPNGLTWEEFEALPRSAQRGGGWEPRMRNAHVYVKGNVRHPDHKTVFLSDWHEVVPNTETRARAMSQVAFLD